MKYINNLNIEDIKLSFNDPKKPYRYVVIDDFLTTETCRKFSESYPDIDNKNWYRFRDTFHGEDNVFEKGMMGISNKEQLPSMCLEVINELNSQNFVDILKNITGLEGLTNDTHNEIGQWAGIRAMLPGAYQSIHSDARKHPHLGTEKRITLVGYVNKEWTEKDSGYTEVWNDNMTECIDKVAPKYNRILVFENTEKSYHGVPEVKNYRKTFLTSYLLNEKSFNETRPKARFMKRPNEQNTNLWDKLSKIRENLNDY
tara:strand:- start:3226 stop:3996 length:771 start_codon:yes stop_codon:yes gene_type:complete